MQPAPQARAVQRCDHRNLDHLLDPVQLLQVLVGAQRVVVPIREERKRLRERLPVAVQVVIRRRPFQGQLLLEQRVHHDRRGAGVLEPAHRVQVVHQRRGAGHQRMREAQAEIHGAEVHLLLPS